MKKRSIFLAFFIMIFLVGCGLETKTLPEFYQKDISDVSKIVIGDGNTGYKKTFTDKKVIDDFLNKIKDIKFIPDENQEDRSGTNYSISLFEGDEKTFSFTLIQVNDHYYHTEPDIYPIVDDFYKHLNVKEE